MSALQDHSPAGELTELLQGRPQDPQTQKRLEQIIYDQLRAIAGRQMWGDNVKMDPTELVHTTWIRLLGGAPMHWPNRRYFFGAAARAMRRIRVEAARRKNREQEILDEVVHMHSDGNDSNRHSGQFDPKEDPLALDRALRWLETVDAETAEVVHLRYYLGLKVEEVARLLGRSKRFVVQKWTTARALLQARLDEAI